jgi:Ca2+-binding RTX toxin-like protein
VVSVLALVAFAAPADAAKCTKRGTNGDDVLRGTKKADVLCGRGGNDILLGKNGKDRLLGGDGDDTLDGGAGKDSLDGQEGVDTATFADATGTVVVNLASGTASGRGNDKLAGVENVTGSAQNDILTGDDADNSLAGGDGDDTLAGGGGADILDGAAGTDRANYFAATGSIDADLAADTATGQGADSLPGVENVTGSPQDDSLAGDAGNNVLHGGAGSDTISFDAATSGVTVDLLNDSATGEGNDSLPAIENVIGSSQADTIAGDAARNVIDGGVGADTVTYAGAASAVTVDLVNGTVAGGDTDTLDAVENVIGTTFDDALIGGGGVNELRGGDGGDTIAGGAGEDELIGQGGDDRIYGEPANDVLSGGDGDDTLDGGPGVDSCDGGTGTNQFAGGCDTDAPQLEQVTIFPGSIDTSSGPEDVTFTLELADAVTGIDAAASEVALAAPNGTPRGSAPLELVAGTQHDGTFEATISVPHYAPEGAWTAGLLLADNAGNEEAWSAQELAGAGFPASFDQEGSGDEEAPELATFSIAPGSFETSGASQDVTFTLGVTDDLAGLDLAGSRVEVFSPLGEPRGSDTLSLVSGTFTNGTFEAVVTVPRYSPQGAWTVSVLLSDNAGNEQPWSSQELAAASFPGGFNQTGAGDEEAPVLTAFALDPVQSDTTAAPQTVTFDLNVTDAPSGLDAGASKVIATPPAGPPLESSLQLLSGDPTDGAYRATITVPQGASPGTWIVSLVLVDTAQNVEAWSSDELIGAGFPGSFVNVGLDPN